MSKKNFLLLHFKGHNFCHTLTAGPQFTFMGQGSSQGWTENMKILKNPTKKSKKMLSS